MVRGPMASTEPEPGASQPPARPPASGGFASLTTLERTIGIAAAVVLVSAFLPWVSIFGLSVSGINGDGGITLILALIGLAALAASRGIGPVSIGRRATQVIQLLAGLLVVLVGLADLHGVSAIGLYLTLLAGLVWAGAAIAGLRRQEPGPGRVA